MSDAVGDPNRPGAVVATDDETITVLHVDDEANLVETAALWLERENDRLSVVTETSVADALDRLHEESIDCIVSDYDMPGTNGLAFLETVRETHPNLPFILFTGKGSEEIASEAITAGVTDYLQKEVGADQYTVLANRIERAVEERRTAVALAESERVLSTLLSNVPGMVYRRRNERGWPMEFVSAGALDVIGYDPAELIDGAVSYGESVVHPEDREDVWRAVQAAIEDAIPFKLEYRVRTKQDDQRWVFEQGRAVDTGDDGVVLEGVVTDITERKAHEQALETERDRLSALFEHVDTPLVYFEFEGETNWPTIREVNDAFEETFGYDASAVLGELIDDVLVPDANRGAAQENSERLRAGERLEYEATRTTADGERLFQVRTIPMRPGESGEEGWVMYSAVTE